LVVLLLLQNTLGIVVSSSITNVGSADLQESRPADVGRSTKGRRKILAISSRGGHWIQLLRLRPAFEGSDVVFVTTELEYQSMVDGAKFRVITEATRNEKLRMLKMLLQIVWIFLRERPTAVVTTGAAPGYFAVRLGKLLGAKTLWIDSIANAEELSLSGRLASKHADVTLTQWSHLAAPGVVRHCGAVI
jgi:UDP-N-acetylglucosamine:LPS N-acetylglucosamine transferase